MDASNQLSQTMGVGSETKEGAHWGGPADGVGQAHGVGQAQSGYVQGGQAEGGQAEVEVDGSHAPATR